MIYKYKVIAGEFILKRDLKKLKREKRNFSLDTAQTIGILYEYKNDEDFKTIEYLIHELRSMKKEVKVLSYIEGNNMLDYIPQKLSVDFFQLKDLSWYLSPKSTYLRSFINTKYDILIDLNIHKSFPLKYIAACSRSSYKVGIYDEEMKDILDLLVKPTKKLELKALIQEILHFLNLLKPE